MPVMYNGLDCNYDMSSVPASQLHWPVSERRKMECLVSGKDAIVSTPVVDGTHKLSGVVLLR